LIDLVIIRQWTEPTPCEINEDVLGACAGDSFIAQLLIRRGLTNVDQIQAFLSSNKYSPALAEQLPDLVTASELLRDAIENKMGKRQHHCCLMDCSV
jgi:hypothetical protein